MLIMINVIQTYSWLTHKARCEKDNSGGRLRPVIKLSLHTTSGPKASCILSAQWKRDNYLQSCSRRILPGREEQNGCETFVIKKGEYWGELIAWRKDESTVGKTFQKLLRHPNLDKSGYCLEIYPNECRFTILTNV